MQSISYRFVRQILAILSLSALAGSMTVCALPAWSESPAGPASINPAATETCVAVFTVMAYAYADDDLKERQLEEKKLLAQAALGSEQDEVSMEVQPADPLTSPASSEPLAAQPQSSQSRIEHIMDILTEMMLDQPAQAQDIARECFRKYPPEIELN